MRFLCTTTNKKVCCMKRNAGRKGTEPVDDKKEGE